MARASSSPPDDGRDRWWMLEVKFTVALLTTLLATLFEAFPPRVPLRIASQEVLVSD